MARQGDCRPSACQAGIDTRGRRSHHRLYTMQQKEPKGRSRENIGPTADGQLDDLISVLRTGEAFADSYDGASTTSSAPRKTQASSSASSSAAAAAPAKKKVVGTVSKKGADVGMVLFYSLSSLVFELKNILVTLDLKGLDRSDD